MRNGKVYPNKPGLSRLNIIALFVNIIALLSTIWIVIPAPAYNIWLFSVLASEWSLGFGLFALVGIFLSLLAKSRLRIAAFLIGLTALGISFYPFLSVYSIAQKQNISLSWREYLSGFWAINSKADFSTRTFADIDGNDLKVDVYAPPNAVERKNVGIVVVHGGSWGGGGRSDFPRWNEWFIKQGFTVFDIDYRLAPQPNWQTATGDVKCAVGWIQQNAAEFQIQPDKIVLMGRSAGGQLALLAAYSADSPQLSSSCSSNQTNKVRAVISFYAPTDLIWGFDNPANQRVINGRDTLSRFLGGNPHESDAAKNNFLAASPVNNVNSETPPTLLIHGGQDQLVRFQHMDFLSTILEKNKVPYQTIFIPYAQHGFDYNFNGWGAQIIKPQILEFLLEYTK